MKGELSIYAGMALAAGPILFLRGFHDLRVRRLIQNTPTARIRSMAMGHVEVKGTVMGRSAIAAPFSGRPCVYWQVEVAVRSRRDGWTTVHRNASGHPFYVQDETGVALVYPEGSQCRATITGDETCLGINLPDVYAQYLSRQRLGMRYLWRMSSMRFRERVIVEGEPIYVLGEAQPRARSVAISDVDEALATGTDGPARLHGERLRSLHHDVAAVVRRGRYEGAFIISPQSERDLCLDLGIGAFFKLIGGPVLALLGLGYWLFALSSLAMGGRLP